MTPALVKFKQKNTLDDAAGKQYHVVSVPAPFIVPYML